MWLDVKGSCDVVVPCSDRFPRQAFAKRSLSTPRNTNAEDVIQLVKNSPASTVKLAAFDIDGVPRGKYINKEKFASVAKNGLGFCSVVFGWDSAGTRSLTSIRLIIALADVLYDNTKEVGWHMGYADFPCSVDLSTFR